MCVCVRVCVRLFDPGLQVSVGASDATGFIRLPKKYLSHTQFLYRPHLRKRHDGRTVKDDECSKGRCVIPYVHRSLLLWFFWLGRHRALFESLLVVVFRMLNLISFCVLTFPSGLRFEKVAGVTVHN